MFDAFGRTKPSFGQMVHFLLVTVFPVLWRLPIAKAGLVWEFSSAAGAISKALLAKTRSEKAGEKAGDRSVMGLLSEFDDGIHNSSSFADDRFVLVKASDGNSELRVTDDEVLAQMKVLILAGGWNR